MKHFFLFALLACTAALCQAQNIEIVTLSQLQKRVLKKNDTLYVVNFWATWCKPCIQELPYFEQSRVQFKSHKLKILLVSLDFKSDIAQANKLKEKKDLKNQVLLLDESNPNVWINKVDKAWSGAIPATVLYKGGKKIFFKEGEFKQTELESLIKSKLNIKK
ncbi:MAG TPA: TlpA disulfide reductase family protein [Cytophagales bacterium]|nr:TlpA disulfide reductase family protein [Cytophagales bacterium]